MLRSVAIVAVAVISSLLAAHGMSQLGLRRSATASAEAAPAPSGEVAALAKAADGHFWAEATVNGKRVRFLVDTGATTVALTAADARRLGLDLGSLDFDRPVATAGGETRAALVELDYVSVAGARVDRVEALVLEKGLPSSLLGMSYLGRLSRIEATRTALILRP